MTDSIYVSRSFTGTYESGHLLDAGWTVAFLLVTLAAAAPCRLVDRPEATRLNRIQEPMPYVPAVMALVVAGVMRIHWTTTPFLFWTGSSCWFFWPYVRW